MLNRSRSFYRQNPHAIYVSIYGRLSVRSAHLAVPPVALPARLYVTVRSRSVTSAVADLRSTISDLSGAWAACRDTAESVLAANLSPLTNTGAGAHAIGQRNLLLVHLLGLHATDGDEKRGHVARVSRRQESDVGSRQRPGSSHRVHHSLRKHLSGAGAVN